MLLGLVAAPLSVDAQQVRKFPRIGSVSLVPASERPNFSDALLRGLREHGYVVGKTLLIERRSADGKRERLVEPRRLAPSAFLLARGTRHTADITG